MGATGIKAAKTDARSAIGFLLGSVVEPDADLLSVESAWGILIRIGWLAIAAITCLFCGIAYVLTAANQVARALWPGWPL